MIQKHNPELLQRRVIVLVGGYGSGKTQTALSLALRIAGGGEPVALIDLDIINPYFRSREVRKLLCEQGVEPICPAGDLAFAENPSLVPEIDGALRDSQRRVVLDAGGDETGATVVGRYHGLLASEDVSFLQVVNIFRPFSSTIEEIEAMRRLIEQKTHCPVDGWINNSHLQEWTTRQDWEKAQELMRQLIRTSQIPLAEEALDPVWAKKVGIPWQEHWIPIQPFLRPSWKKS